MWPMLTASTSRSSTNSASDFRRGSPKISLSGITESIVERSVDKIGGGTYRGADHGRYHAAGRGTSSSADVVQIISLEHRMDNHSVDAAVPQIFDEVVQNIPRSISRVDYRRFHTAGRSAVLRVVFLVSAQSLTFLLFGTISGRVHRRAHSPIQMFL